MKNWLIKEADGRSIYLILKREEKRRKNQKYCVERNKKKQQNFRIKGSNIERFDYQILNRKELKLD